MSHARPVLGLVTVGQSPRVDVTAELAPLLASVDVVEHGALDDASDADLRHLADRAAGATKDGRDDVHVLATRLRDGGTITYLEEDALPRTQAAVERAVADGATSVLIACTGRFPPFAVDVPVVLPDKVLHATAAALSRGGPVLVFTPDAAQVDVQRARWQATLGRDVPLFVLAENPYLDRPVQRFADRAAQVAQASPHLVVFDCIGYDHAMADAATASIPRSTPVLVARTVAARIALALAT